VGRVVADGTDKDDARAAKMGEWVGVGNAGKGRP
jgi:hypothetical protein